MKFKLTCEANPGPADQKHSSVVYFFFFFANSVFWGLDGVLIALWLMLLIIATGHLGL